MAITLSEFLIEAMTPAERRAQVPQDRVEKVTDRRAAWANKYADDVIKKIKKGGISGREFDHHQRKLKHYRLGTVKMGLGSVAQSFRQLGTATRGEKPKFDASKFPQFGRKAKADYGNLPKGAYTRARRKALGLYKRKK